MHPDQDRIFAETEGDRWFERNRDGFDRFDPNVDLPLKLISLYDLRPKKVLEIGAANGTRLAALQERFRPKLVAVEPSAQAIADGKSKFPFIEFFQGVASAIPVEDRFDLVIVNFVFHWIDRLRLLRSVSEVDRLIAEGGFLILGDFLPSNPTKVIYHHLPGQEIYTYKQNYAETFLASGIYHKVGLLTADHSAKNLQASVPESDRYGVWLLQKRLHEHYL